MQIDLDFSSAASAQNTRWRGMGMVSGNNSSRLLMDYKALHPEKYNELLQLMFGTTGIGIQHLKIEMGSDINSSSGTEPCTMRYAAEKADVTRGAGFMLCADAKKINPDLTLDMLWWGEPLWIEKSSDINEVYAARYSWYKGNLVEAYKTYGLRFDFVSATQNERGWDANWIKYLSAHLKTDEDVPYDFSKIKIVAGEEVCTWNQSKMMLEDPELLAAVDVIGSHYTSWSDENTKKLRDFGKEVWFSEGSSPMGYSTGLHKYDGNGSGLNGLNGVLDVANRIITMYPGGKMTLCEFQPVIAAYYDGICYCHKQFITANTPWNGYYKLDPGFFMTLHFSQFIERGWAMLDKASFADGKPAGDGHSIGEALYSFVSACNPETKDWSTVITNTTSDSLDYELIVPSESIGKTVYLYETTGWKLENTLKKSVLAVKDYNKITVSIKPNSIVTVSTLNREPVSKLTQINKNLLTENVSELESDEQKNILNNKILNKVLSLPYNDDFTYPEFPEDFLASRGMAPLFTTDEGGAFEIEQTENCSWLLQKINKNERAKEWGWTPEPVTNLGDDRWFNYSAQITAKFASGNDETCERNCCENYVGLGIRYNLPSDGQNGYWLKLYQNGKWCFCRNNTEIVSGSIKGFDTDKDHKLFISAENNLVELQVDTQTVLHKTTEELKISMQGGGRAAIFSAYYQNRFKDFQLKPIGKNPYIVRFDNFADCFEFIEEKEGNQNGKASHWQHGLMESFKYYRRTVSHGSAGSRFNLKINGTGFNLTGNVTEETSFKIRIDGISEPEVTVNNVNFREAFYRKAGLSDKNHVIEFTILKGKLNIDSVEVLQTE